MTHFPQLEHVVAFLSKHTDGVPEDKKKVHELQNVLVKLRSLYHSPSRHTCVRLHVTVYDDLSRPPATYLGTPYSYRTADGSFNNISDPKMGKAAEPFARSVQQTHALPRNMLPEADLVFNTLLKREKVQVLRHLRSSSTS